MKKRHFERFRAVFVPIAAVLLAFLAIASFSRGTSKMLTDSAYRVLREESSLHATTFKAKLDGLYSVLRAFSSSIGNEQSRDIEDIKRRMASIVDDSEFYSMAYVGSDGAATLYNGDTTSVADRKYFKSAINGELGIEFVLVGRIDGKARFIISAPVYRMDEVDAVVFGSILVDNFSELLISESYGRASYSFVTDGAGDVIIRTKSEYVLSNTNDMLDFFSQVELEDGVTLDEIRTDIARGGARVFSYSYKGTHRYASFSPLGIEDWCVFNVLPGEVVEAETSAMNFRISLLALELAACMALLFAYSMNSDRKKMNQLERDKELLRQSEESYDTVMRLSEGVLFIGDYASDTLTFNPYYRELFGHEPICERISDCVKPNPLVHPDDVQVYLEMGERFQTGAVNESFEFRVKDSTGIFFWQRTEFTTVYDEGGKPLRLIGRIAKIDEQKKQLISLRSRAESDSLSRLLNHSSFEARVRELLAGGEGGAFFLLDVDNFKQFNDTYGHPLGDSVITAVAEQIKAYFRSGDAVGRIGGDEFAAFAAGSVDDGVIRSKAEGLCESIRALRFEGNPGVSVTCSMGVARTSKDNDTFEKLYESADKALYAAKGLGRNAFHISE